MADARVTLVTGAASGIGRAIADRLAADGGALALLDRDPGVEDTAAQIKSAHGGEVLALTADVADPEAVRGALARLGDRYGRLDGLVANAGIMIEKPLEELTLAEWRAVIDTNLTGAFLCVQAAVPLLRAAPTGQGAIVTMASTRASMSEPHTESYAASKGGLVALTHALALSLGPAVRVNAISPGWIDVVGDDLTPEDHAQHPAGRVGRPEDVAALAVWLLGPEARFVTGAEFVVDGGMTRKMIYAE